MIRVFLKKGLLGEEVSHFDMAAVVTPRALRADFLRTMSYPMPIDVAVDGQLLGDDAPELDQVLRDGQQVILMPKTTYDVLVFLAYAVVYALVAYGVNYLIQVLWPASKPQGVAQERGDDSSATFAWDGTKTNYGPGLPIPWCYGRHIVGGQVIWTDSVFGSLQTGGSSGDKLTLVLSLCEGPTHRIGERSGSIDRMGIFPSLGFPQPTGPLPVGLTVNGNLIGPDDSGVGASIRPGTQDQTPLPAPFSGVRQAFSVIEELPDINSAFVFTFSGVEEVSGVSLVFVMPVGAYIQNASGVQIGIATSVEIAWRPVGATSWSILTSNFIISQASIARFSVFGRTFASWEVLPGIPTGTVGPIEIRARRTTANAGTSGVAQLIWRDVIIHSPHTLRYPLESLLGLDMEAGSRFSGGLPQITVPVEGALVRVWDATNGWSPRCWNVPAAPFNFHTHAPGRNPAWCLLDFLLARWGLGHYLTEANIDLPAFRAWAAFCDSDPNPADPWDEPSFTIDLVGDQPRPAWDWVLTFCNAGRASPTVRNGKISIVYHYRDSHGDAGVSVPAKTPTQLITSGNCEKVQVKWVGQATRPTLYQFQFLDEEKNWAQDVFPVEDDDGGSLNDPSVLNQDKYRPETIQAWGVTRKSQLYREGVWRHRITRMVRRELTFVTGPWALAAEVGDLIDFEHEVLRPFATDVQTAMQVIQVADPTHVTLDHELSGAGLQIVVRDPDGKPQKANISSYVNTEGISDLVLATSVTVVPGAACVVGKVGKLVETYCIVACSLQKDLKREVQCIQWTPDAYDPLPPTAIEESGETVVDEPPVSEAPPLLLGILAVARIDNRHRITWAKPGGQEGSAARVYLRRDHEEDPWELIGATQTSEILTQPLLRGERYRVSVCLLNRRGDSVMPGQGSQITFVASEGLSEPSPAMLHMAGEATGSATSVDLSHDGLLLVDGNPGIPITGPMVADRVTVSFKAGSAPAGPGVATLWRRPVGGYFTPAATAQFQTSP